MQATPTAAAKLEIILNDFAAAIGLQINFQKTTFLALNVDPNTAKSMDADLQTTLSIFPQTYLGLSLCPIKLPSTAFQPIIDMFDRYLSGWTALPLTKGGRLVLLSAVLDSLPTYFMGSFLLPKLLIERLDKKGDVSSGLIKILALGHNAW